MCRAPLTARKVAAFDLVELAEDHAPHRAGQRGTVILLGGCDALVDFAWADAGLNRRNSTHLAMVPYERLKIIDRRVLPAPPPETEGK